jgi:hypothetical protein
MKLVKAYSRLSGGAVAMSGLELIFVKAGGQYVKFARHGAVSITSGTDTCIKIGGYLRVDTTLTAASWPAGMERRTWSGRSLPQRLLVRSRAALTLDTRTATEYGVGRTFSQADFQFTTLGSQGGSSSNPNQLNTNLGNNAQLLDTDGGGYTAVEYVFIQFAGFTFGKSSSAYATPWNGYPGKSRRT